MPRAKRNPKKLKLNLDAQTFNLSSAKTYLGRLMEKASQGESVYIVRGQRCYILQEIAPIEPIPIRPPGYFGHAYSNSDIQEENCLAKTSVVRPPKDLE
jgi:hypothetical protein